MPGEDLREAVEDQARAHVARDDARFASWMTESALLGLGRTSEHARGIAPKRYRVLRVESDGAAGTSSVRYEGRGSYVIEQRWERSNGAWKAVAAERPPAFIRPAWWRRLLPGGEARPPDRRELS